MGTTHVRADLLVELLNFDRTTMKRTQCLVSWKEIAFEVGVGESTLRRWALDKEVELPRWGPPGGKSPVFVPRSKVAVFKALLFGT